MKIRKFNENEEIDISSDRIEEVSKQLKDFSSMIGDKSKLIESLLSELSNYANHSKKGNDQIDDSISALQIIQKDITDCSDKIDTVINNLLDYNEKGRNFLYTDEK